MTITGSHGLDDAPDLKSVEKRSTYCYLFKDLANEETCGRFPDTDEEGTFRRLIAFAEACDLTTDELNLSGLTIPVPAAFTYFGQFMNHDMSAPMGGLLRRPATEQPAGIIGTIETSGQAKDWRAKDIAPILEHFLNEHEAPLTLSSLYGDGPESDDDEVRALYNPDGTFKLGTTDRMPPQFFTDMKIRPADVFHARSKDQALGAPDLPRWPAPPGGGENAGRPVPPKDRHPLIADRRNDGNLILGQLHLAFMLCHNKAVAALGKSASFAEARQLVTLHYHWLILNEFLPAILSRTVLGTPLSEWDKGLELPPQNPRSVPMEFTTAAFRFGHSMVGRVYDYNANFGKDGRIDPTGATLRDLMNFTSRGAMGNPDNPPLQLPDHWVIDWERLTRDTLPGGRQGGVPGQAEGIDFDIAPDMLERAGEAPADRRGSILFRNLLRGFHRRIPFGQTLAMECWGKGHRPLSPDQILAVLTDRRQHPEALAAAARDLGILTHTPAWLYFLSEAKSLEQGERVGPTASRIIAATLVGLMRQNRNSVLNHKGGGWTPSQSPLRDRADKPLESLRAFLLFATEEILSTPA